MSEKNLMHVKLEFEEARDNKKEVLALEIAVLKLLTIIRKYHELRLQELTNKKNINIKLKSLSSNITKIKRVIPNVQVPKKYQKRTTEDHSEELESPITLKRKKSDVEEQLQDIQNRLKDLDEKF
jgi:hypothetical protein